MHKPQIKSITKSYHFHLKLSQIDALGLEGKDYAVRIH